MRSETVRNIQTAKVPYKQATSPAISDNQKFESESDGLNKSFWLVELDKYGTVIYSRSYMAGIGDESAADMEGRNFFDEFKGFDDITKCRQNFQAFINSRKAAESFIWRRSHDNGNNRQNRVFMTRTIQREYNSSRDVVMMEIRDCL